MRRPVAFAAIAILLALVAWWAGRGRAVPTRGPVQRGAPTPAPAIPSPTPDRETEAPHHAPGWRLSGTVVDREGRPAAGQPIECQAPGRPADTTVSNEAGAFAFAGLPLQRWTVRLKDAPWAAVEAYSGDEDVRLALPEMCSVEGRVVGISPGEEAWICTDGPERTGVAEDGTIRLERVEPGARAVFARAFGRPDGEAVACLDLRPLEERRGVELVIPSVRSWIRVRVLDADGFPVRASVTAEPPIFLPADAPTLGRRAWFDENSGILREDLLGIHGLALSPADSRADWESTTDEEGYASVPAPEEPGAPLDVTVDAKLWPLVTIRLRSAPVEYGPVTTIRLPRLERAHVRVVDEHGTGIGSFVSLKAGLRMLPSDADTGEHEFLVACDQAYDVLALCASYPHATASARTYARGSPCVSGHRIPRLSVNCEHPTPAKTSKVPVASVRPTSHRIQAEVIRSSRERDAISRALS